MDNKDKRTLILFVVITIIPSYFLIDGLYRNDLEQIAVSSMPLFLFGFCWYIVIFTKPIDRNESYFHTFRRKIQNTNGVEQS